MMAKKWKGAAVLLLAGLVLWSFLGCATVLHGTYTSKDGLIEQSFTFKDDNKVSMSAFGVDIEGDYRIENGKITITYSLFGLHYDWENSFEKKGNSIFIEGTEFVKE